MPNPDQTLETQIDQWRNYLRRRQAVASVDIEELEDHLREQVATLSDTGLDTDEAFLVAVKRMGNLDTLSREFAREHSDRLWKQLVVSTQDDEAPRSDTAQDTFVAICFAIAAALAVKVPALLGYHMDEEAHQHFYGRNANLFVLPLLTAYFVWKRRHHRLTHKLAAMFILAIVFVNIYPFQPGGHTEVLTVLHLPIALWLAVGIAYAGERWQQTEGRMDFIRFSGELAIYFALIGLGGGVRTMFVVMIYQTIGINAEFFVEHWMMPCGAAGAVIVASWLVEAKQSVIENMAPVLTRLFTPLFTGLLITFLVALLWTGNALDIERHLLISFDLLLVVVLGLLLYAVSARDPRQPPGMFDYLQIALVVSALLADAVALWAISARISEFGFTPNRVAALGENVILLVNLGWSTVLYLRFLRGTGSFVNLEKWQTSYVPVYAVWAAIVVVVFPPLFSYT